MPSTSQEEDLLSATIGIDMASHWQSLKGSNA
jgi:hypothetical protein